MSWNPPIGVPTPNWGGVVGNPIDTVAPTPPSPWTADIAGYYFVESGGTNGGNGYPGNPISEIPFILPAGSKVFVNGVYTKIHDPYYIRHAGTAASPCWILSFDPANPAKFTGQFVMTNSDTYPCRYLIVENIHWDWSATGGSVEFGGGVNHVCFRNCSTLGAAIIDPANPNFGSGAGLYHHSGIVIQSSGSLVVNPTEQLVFYNMNMSRGGNWGFTEGDPDAHGFGIAFPTQDIWIVDNEISYFSGCAVQIGTGSNGSVPDTSGVWRCYVGRNYAHHIAQTPLFSKRSNDCVFSQNTVDTIRRDCPSSPNSGGFGGQYGPRNCWFLYNTVSNCQGGIGFGSGADNAGGANDTDIYIVGNLFLDIHDTTATYAENWRGDANSGNGTAMLLRGGKNHYIVNNTFDGYDGGILCPIAANNRFIEGNIFLNRNPSKDSSDITLEYDAGGLNTIRNNIFRTATDSPWVYNATTAYTTIAALNAAKGPNNISTAPVFGNGHNLTAGSAGLDAFTAAPSVYSIFEARYGFSIQVDHNGGTRPANTLWDMGAFEYGAVVPNAAAPVKVNSGSISGTMQEGSLLSAYPATFSGIPAPSRIYQWQRCNSSGVYQSDISGATSTAYELVTADVGYTIRFYTSAANNQGTASDTSPATAVVISTSSPAVTFSSTKHIIPGA